MRRLFNVLPLVLAALPAAAELPPEIWFSPCGGPSATCVAPRVDHRIDHALIGGWGSQPMQPAVRSYPCGDGTRSFFAEPITEDITATPSPYFTAGDDLSQPGRLQPIADNASETLAQWETASRAFYPVTEAERTRLRFGEPALTGQQLSLVCELKQAVDAAALSRRYDWTNFSRQGDVVSLTAVPKDELERLFYDSFIVDIDSLTGQPSRVRFDSIDASGGNLNRAIALRPWLDESSNDIRLVGYEPEAAKGGPVRTADLSESGPRRLEEFDQPTPPPAPASFDCREPVEASKPDVEAEPTALRETLKKFDRFCRETKRAEIEFTCWDYEPVFEREERSLIHLFLEDHRHGWAETLPDHLGRMNAPPREGYKLGKVACTEFRWSPATILIHDSVSHETIGKIKESDSTWWEGYQANMVFPAWSLSSAHELESQFELRLTEKKAEPETLLVTATPRPDSKYSRSYRRLDILFETDSGFPRAMRSLWHSSGSRTLLVTSAEVNGSRPPVKALKP